MCTFSANFAFDTATYEQTNIYKTRDVVNTHQHWLPSRAFSLVYKPTEWRNLPKLTRRSWPNDDQQWRDGGIICEWNCFHAVDSLSLTMGRNCWHWSEYQKQQGSFFWMTLSVGKWLFCVTFNRFIRVEMSLRNLSTRSVSLWHERTLVR